MWVRLLKELKHTHAVYELKYFEAVFKTYMQLHESHYTTNPPSFPLGL